MNYLTGEASSDILVKGYIKGKGEDDQSTDVHYRYTYMFYGTIYDNG